MNIIDRLIEPFSPQRVLSREKSRAALAALRTVNSGYDRHGASRQKKSLIGWLSRGGSPDEDIVENLETLRERSRDLFMGTPLAVGALKTIRTNVIGRGLRLNASIDYEFLGMTADEADAWEVGVEREFRMWAESTHCDAARKCSFGQLQGLALLSALANGDCFVALPVIRRPGSVYDLRVSLLEGDRVCNPFPMPPGRDILGGIEMGEHGEHVAAWVAQRHPLAVVARGAARPNEWRRVPFYGARTGRPNLLHIAQDWERPGQRRATPLLAPVIETLKQLGRYTDAELMGAVVSSMFTVFVKSNTPSSPLSPVIPMGEQVGQGDPGSYELGSGAIVGLGDNEDVTIANPGRANTAFDSYVMAFCRQVGAAIELPYELLIKHFTASYSASRAALLEAWKMFHMRREWMVRTFCQPIYEEWLSEAVAKGRVQAPGFFEDPAVRAAWCGADWYGPAQGQLNPLNEANAARVRVEEGFSTREKEAAEISGMAWEDIQPVRAREEAQRRRDGTIKAQTDFALPENGERGDEDQ